MLAAALVAALPLVVDVQPRHLAPGEPLRVVVSGAAAVEPPTGRFLGQDLLFLPAPGGDGWVAFAGIDLDIKPGVHPLEIDAGGDSGGTRTIDLRVERKTFPVERLKVEPKYVEPPADVLDRIARESAALREIWKHSRPELLYDGHVQKPLPGVKGRNFGRRRVFNGEWRSPHSGLDLPAPEGTPVQAAARGVVVLADDQYFSGNLVVLDHGAGIYTIYAHLSRIDVAPGQTVEAGAIIGLVGATGRVTGAHLHWGAHVGGARVDPLTLIELLKN
jgi:murein DD-endopeptidase MepM/ murein hydrolase activator NlpD